MKNRTEGRVGGRRREIERERKGAARKEEEEGKMEFEGGSPVQIEREIVVMSSQQATKKKMMTDGGRKDRG